MPANPSLGQVPRHPLQRAHQWAAREHRARPGHLQPLAGGAERSFDEGSDLGTLLGDNRQRLGGEPHLLQGVKPLLRPGDILEHPDRESRRLDVNHRRVSIIGV